MYITFLARRNNEKGAFINNLANGLVLIISITVNLILTKILNLIHKELLVFPFNILMIGFIGIYLPLFYLFISREKHRIRNKNKNIENNKLKPHTELPLKYDIYRKLTHLVVLGIVLFYFTLGFLIQNFFIYLLEYIPDFISNLFRIGGDIMVFTQNLVVFLVGISLLGLLTADFVRILNPESYPLKPVNQLLREKELHFRVGPHISMSIGCFSIIIIFGLIQPIGPVIICTSMVMSIFGDMASNLIGRTMGRKKIRRTNKTYEGLISGIIISFISGLVFLYLIENYYGFRLSIIFLIPLVGALIIGLLDYLDLEIDDNLSFNFSLSIVLFLISIPLI